MYARFFLIGLPHLIWEDITLTLGSLTRSFTIIYPALFRVFMWTCQFCLPFFFYTSSRLSLSPPTPLLGSSILHSPFYLFSSDPLFLTFTVFFSPFLIPLFIFLDTFPLPSRSPPFTLSLHPSFPPPPSFFSSVSNEGLFSSHNQSRGWVMRLMRVYSTVCHLIYGATFPQRQPCVLLWGHFSARRLWSQPLSPRGRELTSLGPSAAYKHRLNIWEFQTSSTLPHRRRSALFRLPPGAVLVGFVLFVDGFLYNQSSVMFLHNEWSWITFPW